MNAHAMRKPANLRKAAGEVEPSKGLGEMHPAGQGVISNGKTQQDKPGDCCCVTLRFFSFSFSFFLVHQLSRHLVMLFFPHLGIFCRGATAHLLVLQVDKRAERSVITNNTRGKKSPGKRALPTALDMTSHSVGHGRATARRRWPPPALLYVPSTAERNHIVVGSPISECKIF